MKINFEPGCLDNLTARDLSTLVRAVENVGLRIAAKPGYFLIHSQSPTSIPQQSPVERLSTAEAYND